MPATQSRTGPIIWVDVEDLLDYFRFNPHPSGIQRVALDLIRALLEAAPERVRLARRGQSGAALTETDWAALDAMMATPPLPEPPDTPEEDAIRRSRLKSAILRLPPELRDPLFRIGVLQSQVLRNVRALVHAIRPPPPRPLRPMPPPKPLPAEGGAGPASGDLFVSLGAPWSVRGTLGVLKRLRSDGVRTALLVHDLIPLRRPEWFPPARVSRFRIWLEGSLHHTDHLLSISRFTAWDIADYAARRGLPLPAQRVLTPGTSVLAPGPVRPAGLPVDGTYVLFVSTLEARKNHALVVKVWHRLMAEVRAGTRPAASVPQLVFAGRIGIGVADLLQQLDNSRWLNGRIRLIREPDDAEIHALYQGCLFTILPSLFEGLRPPARRKSRVGQTLPGRQLDGAARSGRRPVPLLRPRRRRRHPSGCCRVARHPGRDRRLAGRHPRPLPGPRLVRRRRRHPGPRRMTIWFDVEDLVHYFGSGNKRISGIQRLSFEIFRAAKALEGEGTAIGFVRHGVKPTSLLPVAWADLLVDFGGDGPASPPRTLPDPDTPPLPVVVSERPRSLPRRLARQAVGWLPVAIRRPLVLAAVMQVQVFGSVARLAVELALYPVRRAVAGVRSLALKLTDRPRAPAALKKPVPGSFDSLAQPGDTLLVLGAPWNRERYSDTARWLRDERRIRFGVLVHDLVPIRHPEWCPRGVPRMFREWYSDVLPFCDVVFANSRHTAADVEAWAQESGMVLNGRVQPLPVGSGFGDSRPAALYPGLPTPGSYVLFVSTMEARKNHALLVRVWTKLLDDVADGTRPTDSVPDLVFAGRIGWLMADLLAQLDNTKWLAGRIRFVPDPTDAELRALYAGCLFTVFPSLHEGWGLPVTESLALGKPCLTSNAASLPEAGGPLCRYFDPDSLGSALAAVIATLDDRSGLAAWEAQVRAEFRPTPWTSTARAIINAL